MPFRLSHTSCTLSVDIPWSKNAIMTSFNDILNGTAKEITEEYIEMMECLSSLLPTASTKVSATWEMTGKRWRRILHVVTICDSAVPHRFRKTVFENVLLVHPWQHFFAVPTVC